MPGPPKVWRGEFRNLKDDLVTDRNEVFPMRSTKKKGFTVIELIMALALASIVLGLTYQVFIAQRRGYSTQEDVAEMQQNARIASDELARLIKSIGNGVFRAPNPANSQPQLLYCQSYELLFSGDLDNSNATKRVIPDTAITGIYNSGTIYTTDSSTDDSDAEIYQISLSSAGNRHYDLVKKIYHGVTSDNPAKIAENLNIADSGGTEKPLFVYWGYFDDDDEMEPWGDTNNSNALEPNEISALASFPLTNDNLTTYRTGLSPRTVDQAMHHVAIELISETPNPDKNMSTNNGYRQTILNTAVTPRNLWDCPMFATATTPTQLTSAAAKTTTSYSFDVVNNGSPEENRLIIFDMVPDDPSMGADLLIYKDETDSNGRATTSVEWSDCPDLITRIDANGGNPLTFSLTATIGNQPPLNTEMGDCTASSQTITLSIGKGPPTQIEMGSFSASPIYTCGGVIKTTFTATAKDTCGIIVQPDNANKFIFKAASDAAGTDFKEYEITSGPGNAGEFIDNSQIFTVQQSAFAVSGREFVAAKNSDENFELYVTEGTNPGWASPTTGLPLGPLEIIPNVPTRIETPTQNIITNAPHEDCPTAAVDDTFMVLDCYAHPMTYLAMGNDGTGNYSVVPSLNDPNSKVGMTGYPPTTNDLGELTNNNINSFSSPGVYTFTYEPPECIPNFDPDNTMELSYSLTLMNGTNTTDVYTSTNFDLTSCKSCSLTQNAAFVTPYAPNLSSLATVAVNTCENNLNPLGGKGVELVVTNATTPTNDGSFDSSLIITSTEDPLYPAGSLTFSGAGPGPWSDDASVYIGNATQGDKLEVTAYYPEKDPTKMQWSCGPIQIDAIDNLCAYLKIYSDSGYTQVVGNNLGEETCLQRIEELYFEVDDEQLAPGILTNAITVYAISAGGAYLDKERMDLAEYPSSTFPPNIFRSISAIPVEQNDTPSILNGTLTYPAGESVQLYAAYTDPNDLIYDDHDDNLTAPVAPFPHPINTQCENSASLSVPLPICFPNAITSAGGATWNGNFNIHWGDVVIMGNADIPSASKMIAKIIGGQFNGSSFSGAHRTDRFFDIYVGKDSPASLTSGNFLGEANPDPNTVDRPYIGTGYGNYFRNVPHSKILEMITFMDYDLMKDLAKNRNAYWYTLASGNIRNPFTGVEVSFITALTMVAPSTLNAYHDGVYMFIDTYGSADPGPSTTGAAIDATATGSLPMHSVSGAFYTEGIIYIAGSVNFSGLGATTTISAETPPEYEIHYNHNEPIAVFNPNDSSNLPIRSDPAEKPASFSVDVHINGAFYADGVFDGNGNPAIFGSITTERGYVGSGTPELWYNYNLNVGLENDAMCINCCSIEIDPPSASILQGDSVTLTANNAAGSVTWTSLDPATASVDSSGNVKGLAIGSTFIKVTDDNNCVARATIEVTDQCDVFEVDPAIANINSGGFQLYTAMNPPSGSSITWSSADPGIATIDPSTGIAQGMGAGTTTITATDTPDQCDDVDAVLTVSCSLEIDPASSTLTVGDATSLTANNASGAVAWSSSNSSIASVDSSGNIKALADGNATITATDAAGCSDNATITVNAAACRISVDPTSDSIAVGDTTNLTANDAVGAVTWTSSNSSVAAVNSSGAVTGAAAGSATITATDTAGCSSSSTITVNCALSVSPASNSIAAAGTTTLTANNPTGIVTWSSSDTGVATVNSSGVVTGVSGGTATITATDSGGCSDSSTITVTAAAACNLTISPAGPIALLKGDIQALTANNANGTVSWTTTAHAWVELSTTTGLNTNALAKVKNKTVFITATDSTPASCSVTVTINTN